MEKFQSSIKNAQKCVCGEKWQITGMLKDKEGYQQHFMKRGANQPNHPFDSRYFVFLNKQLKNKIK